MDTLWCNALPLLRSSWVHLLPQVPAGSRARLEHDCGGGRTLLVTHDSEGHHAWCFRCGEGDFVPAPTPSLSERLAALERARSAEVRASSSVALPEPRQYDFTHAGGVPLAARVWLYKAGLSNDDIEAMGIYYHEPTQRVIMPVMRDGECIYWQGRDPTWTRSSRRPKYINPPVDKYSLCAKYGSGPVIVLTEDMLSAYRVARVTEAWSIMGTALAPGVLAELLQQRKPVVLMFDPDAGGQKANSSVYRTLSMLGVPVRIARTERDPKYLSKEQTCDLLKSFFPQWPQVQ